MPETESSSKKERMVYDSGRDRLSELPSSIIDIILSSISTRDAVRMSILSRQFRYTWTSLPHLVFDKSEFRSKECMDKFVINVLKLHKDPIHKFTALLKQNWPIANKWLLILPENDIRELILKFEYEFSYHPLISSAYSFNKLTRLELHRCYLSPRPLTFTGFLFLRYLILVNVRISLKDVESIVADSPLLETLKLDGCYRGFSVDNVEPKLKISSPSLKYLDLESNVWDCKRFHLYAPLLAEMSVRIPYDDYERCEILQESRYYNYANFFGGCNSLQKLKGNYFIKVMSYGFDSWQYSFVLPCLKVIELDDVKFGVVKQISIVARLVAGAPNLQELKLTCDKSDSELEAPDVSCTDILSAPGFKWENLKIIKISNLTSLPSKIKFLKLLLENSPALERMNLHTRGFAFQEVKNLREELLKCNLASPNFTLWFC